MTPEMALLMAADMGSLAVLSDLAQERGLTLWDFAAADVDAFGDVDVGDGYGGDGGDGRGDGDGYGRGDGDGCGDGDGYGRGDGDDNGGGGRE